MSETKEHPSIQRNKERAAQEAAMAEFTQMLLASDAAVAPINSPPPLDPDPERGAGDQPAGGALDEIAMSEKGIDLLNNAQKEEDGTPPSPPTLTTYERFQQEAGQFEEDKDSNFLEDNWGKLLTVMAGTALQMVGVHNKNAPMFMGGNALAQLGGVAMADYYSTKENEQQAIYEKYTQEPGSARDVQSALAMAQDYYDRTGEAITAEKAAEFLSLFNFTDDQIKSLSDQMMSMGEQGADVKQALGQLDVEVGRLVQTYRRDTGIVGAMTPEQLKGAEQYVLDDSKKEGSKVVGVGTTEGAKALEASVATAANQPMSASAMEELGLDQDERRGTYTTDVETIMKWAGFPASQATAVDQININGKFARTVPVMAGTSGLVEDEVFQSTHQTTYAKIADNIKGLIEVRGNKAVIPKTHSGTKGVGGTHGRLFPGGVVDKSGVEYVQVLKHPVHDIGIDSARDLALRKLTTGLDENDESVFHPDFLAYMRELLQEGIVRQ